MNLTSHFRANQRAFLILIAAAGLVGMGIRARALEPAPSDPAPRTSLSDRAIRFSVAAEGRALLQHGPLRVVVVDNRAVDDDLLAGHRAGYSGLGSLTHTSQPRNLFVPAYAGLNFEHILDGTAQPRDLLFEPRRAPVELRIIDGRTAELYQSPTPHYGLESCTRYQLLDGGVVEMTFECIPRRKTFANGYIHLFWASYIDHPESLDIHFRGRPADQPAGDAMWVRGVTPAHGTLATHRALEDRREFAHVDPFPLELPFGFSQHRYARPWYFALCRGMAFGQVFREDDAVRFAQSPNGGGAGCPAWDFQWFIPDYQVGRRYQLVMRAVYAPAPEAADEPTVREVVQKTLDQVQRGLMTGSAAALLAPHFRPPPDFERQLGKFRPPLLFDDGTRVASAEDWPRRRAEIFKYWHGVMGQWPPLLDKPKFETLREERRESFSQQRVSLEVAPGQIQEGWLLVPDGTGPFPAVLVVYYEPETSAGLVPGEKGAFRDYGLQLARRGFVTLSIGSPGGNAWKPELGKAVCQPLSFHAYVAANAWTALAGLPQVDAKRIGVVGHSYGGKWALSAAALWEKFAAVAISDPGIVWDETRPNVNYWEPWYLGQDPALKEQRKPGVPSDKNPRTGPYARLVADGRDLTDLHALICPRPFLVSAGSEDPVERWTALNHARAVNDLLGQKDRVAMTNRPAHSPDDKANAVVWAFFEHFLKAADR